MTSLADELLADLGPEGEVEQSVPPQEDAQTYAEEQNALQPMEQDADAHEPDENAAFDLTHDASRPPDPMDQETLDTLDFRKESVDSARSVSKLYGSDTLEDALKVCC